MDPIALLINNVGLKDEIASSFIQNNNIAELRLLYDSDTNEKTNEEVHKHINDNNMTITFIKKKEV